MPNLTNMPNQKYLCQPPPKYAKFQKFGIKYASWQHCFRARQSQSGNQNPAHCDDTAHHQ